MDDQEIREILDSEISDKEKIAKLDELCPNFYMEGKTKFKNKRRRSDEEIVRGKARAFAGM